MGKRRTKQQTVLPTYRDMIETALCALHERNGSSTHAILKYIYGNYAVRERNSTDRQLKLALKSGIRKGRIIQTKSCDANGSFKLLMSRGSTKTKNIKMDVKIRKKTTKTKQPSTKIKNVTQSSSKKKKNMQRSSIKKNNMTQSFTKTTKATHSSTKKKNASQSSTKKRNATQSSTKKETVSQSSTKKKNVTQSSTKKNNVTQFKKNNLTQSSTKKNNVTQSSTKKNNVKQSSTKKTNVNQSSTKKKNVKHSSKKKTTTTSSSSTKTNNTALSKIKGKTRRSSKRAETAEATILNETATIVERNKIEGATRPDHEGSKTNFSKWSNVELILSDSFIIRTLDDKITPRMIGLDIFPDGKILVNDSANNTLKLFDDKGILLYTVAPDYAISGLTISNNSEILASTCPFHDDIVQIFEVKNGVISVKGTIKTKFKIVVLTSFEGKIIALINEEDHRENGESFTVKLFDRAGKVYWSTPLSETSRSTANLLSRIFCVKENGELFCILRNGGDASMAKLNANTGELICELSENVNADSHETCGIFYCSLETDADYVDNRLSDFKCKRILAFGEAGLGYWPHLVQYDKERSRFLVAYDSSDTYFRRDRIDILKIAGAETTTRDSYRFIGKLSNVKQHVIYAVNRVFS